ncbi:MAG: hypothetical protein FWC71_01655 [Defluviitaleaceae bacterium]|nr:hypothetical protein [Defluviitaleaceae bacterium]
MNVINVPISATLRAVSMQNETIQSLHRMRPGIIAAEVGLVLDAISVIRNLPIGNGFLTITNELRQA